MRKKVLVSIVVCPLIMLLSAFLGAESHSLELVSDDCAKCHLGEAQDVVERGGLHNTEVGCTDCHEEHPPKGENTIPTCDGCHEPEDHTHYALENCASCHHPHYPLEMDLAQMDEVKAACVTCHSDQGQEMETHPSEHAGLDCKECHMAHGEATECMECHESHTEEAIHEDCQHCHKPHKPLAVTYTGDIPSSLCISCHDRAGKDLAQSTTEHYGLLCVYCHKDRHKAVPQCETCHGQPHDFNIHEKYPGFHVSLECVECHQNAHAPSQSMNARKMARECPTCHSEQKSETEEHPSAHAATLCVACHDESHGFIASCAKCHEKPHATGVDDAGCIACHTPHSPLEVTYPQDISNHVCAGCHSDVSDRLSGSDEGHAFLQCVLCHADEHGYIPTCQDCHETATHSAEMLKGFEGCVDCHGDAHGLKLQAP